MSRVGKKEITVPTGVTITVKEDLLTVKGPKGELKQNFRPEVSFEVNGNIAIVKRTSESHKNGAAMHGLYRNLLANMVEGVTNGFKKTLLISGTGYRAEQKGESVFFNLGYSTQIEYMAPKGVNVEVDPKAPTKVLVSGISKEQVGQVAAEIRGLRKPAVYSDKGIRYENEVVKRKVGKTGVK
ncbi:MAG: 50S ribosomal protein L6 [Spirochaetaceae bacterium]|nr:50S ribosomal protein L6 [Spirochaetaceae bacterium]